VAVSARGPRQGSRSRNTAVERADDLGERGLQRLQERSPGHRHGHAAAVRGEAEAEARLESLIVWIKKRWKFSISAARTGAACAREWRKGGKIVEDLQRQHPSYHVNGTILIIASIETFADALSLGLRRRCARGRLGEPHAWIVLFFLNNKCHHHRFE